MRIKTIFISIIATLLIIVLIQNSDQISFKFLSGQYSISNLWEILIVAAISFILGWLVGRPRKIKRLSGDGSTDSTNLNTLSDRDKEYLN